jgi:hypothetical protein
VREGSFLSIASPALVKNMNKDYTDSMNDVARVFFKGMGSITLFPQIPGYDELSRVSPWQGVADAFAQTGMSMWTAIERIEPFDAQLEKQPPK